MGTLWTALLLGTVTLICIGFSLLLAALYLKILLGALAGNRLRTQTGPHSRPTE